MTGESDSKKALSQTAYELIKEKIIALHFLPGQYLNEASICAMLDIGRTPVHQALQRLELEGLVEILPRKGVIVQPDTWGEILKILDSRLTVEPELARVAAQRVASGEIGEAEIARLHHLAQGGGLYTDPPDIAAFTVADRAFHQNIGQLSGNQVMAEFAQKLHERSTRFWYLNLWQTLNVEKSREGHSHIADLIAGGDAAAAGQAMREHIEDLKTRLEKLGAFRPHPG